MDGWLRELNPGVTDEEAQHLARLCGSPQPWLGGGIVRLFFDTDVCDVLPLVRVPTLVMHRKETWCGHIRSGHYLAEQIAGARLSGSARRRLLTLLRRPGDALRSAGVFPR